MITEIQRRHGPFAIAPPKFWPNGPAYLQTCGSDDRIKQVKASEDVEWLRLVLTHEDVGLTVKAAAARRLRKLTNAATEAK